MKAYLLEVLILDHDGLGGEQVKMVLENTRYPNRCLSPQVIEMTEADIGEWQDSHPLNQRGTDPRPYFEGSEEGNRLLRNVLMRTKARLVRWSPVGENQYRAQMLDDALELSHGQGDVVTLRALNAREGLDRTLTTKEQGVVSKSLRELWNEVKV